MKEKRNVIEWTVSILTAFTGTWALQWVLHLDGEGLGYTNSIISVFVFLFLGWLSKKIMAYGFEGKWYDWIWPVLFGSIFAFCMVAGTQLDTKGRILYKNGVMWLAMLILAIMFTVLVRFFWDRLSEVRQKEAVEKEEKQKKRNIRSFLGRAGIIFICYIPVFLAVYPGFFVYDAMDELGQVVSRNFTAQHPIIHVLLLGGIIQLVYKLTGAYNWGIACYTVFQMIVMAGIFSWCVERLKLRGMKKWGCNALTLYFGLCPVLVMYALCSAKDGLFTGMMLLFVICLQDLCSAPDSFLKQKWKIILLVLSAVGMMSFRFNGVYAFIVFIPFLLFALRKYWKRIVICLGAVFILYFGINNALTTYFHAESLENQTIVVPVMQVARVYNEKKEELPEKEKEVLYRYLSEDVLARYTPKLADRVKAFFNGEAYAEDSESFLNLWKQWGLRYPDVYLDAWFMTSYGFWYPDTVIDVYRDNITFTFVYKDSSYFGYEVESPGIRNSKIPWLNELYRKMSIEIFQQKMPVISMLFSPGFMIWVMLFLMGFLCYKQKYICVLPFLFPLLCWLTVLLGPTYLVRYVVFLWVMIPLLIYEVMQVGRAE